MQAQVCLWFIFGKVYKKVQIYVKKDVNMLKMFLTGWFKRQISFSNFMLKLRDQFETEKKNSLYTCVKLVCHFIGHIDSAPVLDIYLCFIWA